MRIARYLTIMVAILVGVAILRPTIGSPLQGNGGGGGGGATGATGASGPSGVTGPAGATGATGASGTACTLAIPSVGTCSNQAGVCAVCNLSKAQILALGTTPVTAIPAPGVGKANHVLGGSLQAVFGTIAYSGSNSAIEMTYGGIAFSTSTGIFGVSESVIPLLTATQSEWLPLNSGLLYNVSGGISAPIVPSVISNKSGTLVGDLPGYSSGPILTATLGAAGLLYAPNDTGVIDPSCTVSNCDATYKVLTVGAGGAVLTFSVIAAGTGYPVANGIATGTGGGQPGIGTGFTVNVTSVTTGDGTLIVTLYYQIVNL